MKYNVGDRVAFMTRRMFCFGTEHTHEVGYIKQVRKSLLGTRYVICVAKSKDVYVVRVRDVFGKVERKEKADEPKGQEANNQRTKHDVK